MARGRTTTIEQQATGDEAQAAAAAAQPLDTGFGAEFRELARQRRFVRSAAEPAGEPATTPKAAAKAPAKPKASPAPAPAPKARPVDWRSMAATPASAAAPTTSAVPAPAPTPAPQRAPRLSEDQRATVRELARMSDQLVDAREQLAVATSRVAQLETSLAERAVQLRDANDRVMASRLLVQDAQRAAHEVAERCAALEARGTALEHALELAVNASWLTRWRWRREQRAAARA